MKSNLSALLAIPDRLIFLYSARTHIQIRNSGGSCRPLHHTGILSLASKDPVLQSLPSSQRRTAVPASQPSPSRSTPPSRLPISFTHVLLVGVFLFANYPGPMYPSFQVYLASSQPQHQSLRHYNHCQQSPWASSESIPAPSRVRQPRHCRRNCSSPRGRPLGRTDVGYTHRPTPLLPMAPFCPWLSLDSEGCLVRTELNHRVVLDVTTGG